MDGRYNPHHHRSDPEPPPPQVHHTSHTGPGPAPNAPPVYTVNQPPPQVHHTSHTPPAPAPHHYPDPPHVPSHSPAPPHVPSHSPAPPHVPSHSPAPPHVPSYTPATHSQPHAPSSAASGHSNTPHKTNEFANKPSVRVYCKAETNYSLTIRDGKVVLAPHNSADPLQHWIKDEKYSTRVKDKEGFPSFALINKATGQAMKHAVGATQPVELIPYNSNKLDESVLWTESKDLGDGYHTIRQISNIELNVDAFNGDQKHGGVHDGTRIVLWEWKKDANQRWKIVPQ